MILSKIINVLLLEVRLLYNRPNKPADKPTRIHGGQKESYRRIQFVHKIPKAKKHTIITDRLIRWGFETPS